MRRHQDQNLKIFSMLLAQSHHWDVCLQVHTHTHFMWSSLLIIYIYDFVSLMTSSVVQTYTNGFWGCLQVWTCPEYENSHLLAIHDILG